MDAHDEKDDIRFREIGNTLEEKFHDILDTLSRIELQTTRHNGRLTKLERIMWVLSTAIVILGATGSPIIKLLFPAI